MPGRFRRENTLLLALFLRSIIFSPQIVPYLGFLVGGPLLLLILVVRLHSYICRFDLFVNGSRSLLTMLRKAEYQQLSIVWITGQKETIGIFNTGLH